MKRDHCRNLIDGMECAYPAKYVVCYEKDGKVVEVPVCSKCFGSLVLKLVHRGYKVWKK